MYIYELIVPPYFITIRTFIFFLHREHVGGGSETGPPWGFQFMLPVWGAP